MEREQYATDLTDGQWEIVEPLLPEPCDRGAPRRIDRREVMNAIVYLNRAGCAWRLLPHDFPKWSTVYGIFWEWRNLGVWQQVHDALRTKVREAEGRAASPSAGIIDSRKEGHRAQAACGSRYAGTPLGSRRPQCGLARP